MSHDGARGHDAFCLVADQRNEPLHNPKMTAVSLFPARRLAVEVGSS